MGTRKPISTISYNTKEFLLDKLNELYNKHIIQNWYFICHFPEEDEKKSHIHLYVDPNGQLDCMEFGENFKEFVVGETLPRRCIMWKRSELDDWLLYAVHDKYYLDYKGQSRSYHYGFEELYKCDELQFEQDLHHALYESKFAMDIRNGKLFKQIINENPAELFYQGKLSLGLAPAFVALQKLDRNGRSTHTPKED